MSNEPANQIYFLEVSDEVKNIPRILKAIGMKLTVAPIVIKKHFQAVSTDIKEATPENVFDYYTLYSYQAGYKGSFPCLVTKSKFVNVESLQNFIKYIACGQESIREVRVQEANRIETTKTVAIFPKPPLGFPLLLTADGYIRVFNENNLPIKSDFSGLFPNMLRLFLHPNLLDVGLDQQYFLKPHPENEHLIFEILEKTLHHSLKGIEVVLKGSSVIKIDEALRPLWQCFYEDQVFSPHVTKIVQKWALILSKQDNLYTYSPSQKYLMPLIHPKKLPTLEQTPHDKERKELERQHKIFMLLTQMGMPTAHSSIVRKAWIYCPTLSEPATVLRNLYYLYLHKKQALSSILSDKNIELLFSYFNSIHFMNDELSRKSIKSLPLFKSIDGRYCSLSGEAYLWPQNVCMSGTDTILDQSTVVFLTPDGAWKKLATADTLNIQDIDCLQFYTQYVFPCFSLLGESERLTQLEHIKDKLFENAERVSKMENGSALQVLGSCFINGLKQLPIFLKNGILRPINQFCDPEHPVFKLFPDVYTYPPEVCYSESWIPFFKKMGLQIMPAQDEFLDFCKTIAEGRCQSKEDSRKVSKILLNCLFKTDQWLNEKSFLQIASCIHFVYPDILPSLSWIIPSSTSKIHYIHHRRSHTALVCLKDCASLDCAELIWTVCPVVQLPVMYHPPLTPYKIREERKAAFYANLEISTKPTESQVVENMINISKSRFSNFKLFEKYPLDCVKKEKCSSLFEVVSKNLEYILENFESASSCLVDIPCIPVSNDLSDCDLSKPVMVKPLQVISCSPCQLQSSLHPFLNLLPKYLYSILHMLQGMQVNAQVKIESIIYALDLIRSHVIMPLDPNSIKAVKYLLKLLFNEISINSATLDSSSVLYLPDCNCTSTQSTKLLYDDKGFHKDVKYTFGHSQEVDEFSALSLLCKTKYEENEEYGFDLKSFVSKIPTSHSPLPFSKCINSRLKLSCQEENDSGFVKMLKKAFSLQNFAEIIKIIMKHASCSECSTCDKFASYLKDCLASLNLVTITDLKVDIMLIQPGIATDIGEASMDFLLQDNNKKLTFYIDSKVNPVRYNVLESFSEYFVNEIIKRADLMPSSISNPAIYFVYLLKAENPDDVKSILIDVGLNMSDLVIEQKFDYVLNPKLGETIPKDWHHRLHADLLNSFRPQELVGYEEKENYFIFARIEHSKYLKQEVMVKKRWTCM